MFIISLVWRLGKVVINVRYVKKFIVEVVFVVICGKVLMVGKIFNVIWKIEGGFNIGYVVIKFIIIEYMLKVEF